MTDFIIDEMVIRECDSQTDTTGKRNIRSLDFMTSLIQSNHRVALNKKIERKYRDYQQMIKNTGIFSNPTTSNIINDMLRSDKRIDRDGTPGKYKPCRVKKCDREFVGVSIHTRGKFVTNDKKLVTNIKKQNLGKQFTTVTIDDAKNHL